jgi:hypothetical protein
VNVNVNSGLGRDPHKLAVNAEVKKTSFELPASVPARKPYRFVIHAKPGERFRDVDAFATCISLIAVHSVRVVIFDRLNGKDAVKGWI